MLANIIQYIADSFGSEISYIDEDYGQLEALDSEQPDTYPVTFPAVLITEEATDWSNISELAQKGVTSVRVRLVLECYDDTHASAPLAKEKAAERMSFVHRLHCALQGFRPNDLGGLVRYRSGASTWRHGIKLYDLYYNYATSETLPEKETIGRPKISLVVGGIRNT